MSSGEEKEEETRSDDATFMSQEMRMFYLLLCLATVGCVLWTVFTWSIFPIGPVDGLHGQFKPRLIEELGDQEGRALVSDLSRFLVLSTRSAILSIALPTIPVMFAWMWIAVRAMNRCVQLESELRASGKR